MDNEEEKINVTVDGTVKELVIRHGEAAPILQPRHFAFTGTIDAPFLYAKGKSLPVAPAVVHFNIDSGVICFEENPTDGLAAVVYGQIDISEEIEKWGINNPKISYTSLELGRFIKLNRYYFEKKEVAINLAGILMDLRIKVEKNIQAADDNRGNVRKELSQKIINNSIPESFAINIHIIKGFPPLTIEVSIEIDPDNFECRLVSYELEQKIEEIKLSMMDDELKKFREAGFVVLER